MPEFLSKPKVAPGIAPVDDPDLVTKSYVDTIFQYADGGSPDLGVRVHVSVDAGVVELPVVPQS